MNDMSRGSERAVPERLRGLVVLTPRQQLVATLEQRLRAPWTAMRHSLAGRIKLAAAGLTVLLVIVGLAVGTALLALASRSEQGRVLGEAALASAELTAGIADSRYYASRYAATGAEAEIEKAHATLGRAKERLAQTRAMSVDTETQAVEAMDWLQYQVDRRRASA